MLGLSSSCLLYAELKADPSRGLAAWLRVSAWWTRPLCFCASPERRHRPLLASPFSAHQEGTLAGKLLPGQSAQNAALPGRSPPAGGYQSNPGDFSRYVQPGQPEPEGEAPDQSPNYLCAQEPGIWWGREVSFWWGATCCSRSLHRWEGKVPSGTPLRVEALAQQSWGACSGWAKGTPPSPIPPPACPVSCAEAADQQIPAKSDRPADCRVMRPPGDIPGCVKKESGAPRGGEGATAPA